MNELHLFAGAGGGILGGLLLGHTPICAVEIDKYNQKILLQRQRDGVLPAFPIWDDIKTFDGRPWKGIADVICGGFPCQDISFAGKRAGITGERSGLWKEYSRVLKEIHPRFVFAENSSRLINSGLDIVLQDLAEIGYDAVWGCFSASDVGAPHKRERCFILAYPMQSRDEGDGWCRWVEGRIGGIQKAGRYGREGTSSWDELRQTESKLERVLPDGVAYGVDRHYAIGNGQVPEVVRLAWNILSSGI